MAKSLEDRKTRKIWQLFTLLLFCCFLLENVTTEECSPETRRAMEEAQNLSDFINSVIQKYHRNVRPNAGGKKVMVEVEFKVISFGEIKEAEMEYSMDIFFRQWWYDRRFAHNFSTPFTMAADPTEMFWTPDTYFWNVKQANYHRVTRENMRVMINPDGKIYFSARITLTLQCDMDLRLYPMDTQHCPLRIESYAHTTADVDYRWKGEIEIVSKQMAQFDLLGISTETKDSTNSKGSFARLVARFRFRRRLDFYVSSIYVPEVILVVLSWTTFFITPTAVPARTALSITTILTTILLSSSVNANMPKVSYMKAIDHFMLISFGFIFAALIEYILVLNTPMSFRETFPSIKRMFSKPKELQSPKMDALMDMEQVRTPKRKAITKPKVHWIDQTSKYLFPVAYGLFFSIYWIHYKQISN
ncbi:gamma-aminobutyric acid receptor alpha-like [Exaiptasia diaphana]|uniref:Gamma-aminobutyric acid receptor subunit beta n=1 Tax=Exaiptasia diaphana TaxID=2652724 RepID=A0A913YFY1_EXADI|nr:gamma-aminobutyric acid receptor alpha-like [Exaiptasia diaphana]XP_020898157.1 gamma-aminobutyric acid receptor alpha-like [Exaiptasia diaphana]XP_020898158.1 gamma-aminobutyric acid receptor alpha-like [Exaiptasia diaphana]XP_020898159.1 gamma-aminobutyric acid receptor alpha-like [Exaiptasia diaphana]XP_028514245.1 gamma-aminobutyric acid receptor alpha-like [Exaiptasia diaphana]KXJ15718.1 Glycine receptor subunit alpha-2 [Exaiptasia diaphana]